MKTMYVKFCIFRSRSYNNSNNVCNVNNNGNANNNNYNNSNGLAPDQMELSCCESSGFAAQTSNILNSTPEYINVHLIMVYSGRIGSIKSQEGMKHNNTILINILKEDAFSSKENFDASALAADKVLRTQMHRFAKPCQNCAIRRMK